METGLKTRTANKLIRWTLLNSTKSKREQACSWCPVLCRLCNSCTINLQGSFQEVGNRSCENYSSEALTENGNTIIHISHGFISDLQNGFFCIYLAGGCYILQNPEDVGQLLYRIEPIITIVFFHSIYVDSFNQDEDNGIIKKYSDIQKYPTLAW